MTSTDSMDEKDPVTQIPATSEAVVPFDPSQMIGIIKRKALIKDLAASYQAECLKCCRELLELQKEWGKVHAEQKTINGTRKERMRQAKRFKK